MTSTALRVKKETLQEIFCGIHLKCDASEKELQENDKKSMITIKETFSPLLAYNRGGYQTGTKKTTREGVICMKKAIFCYELEK